MGKERIGFKAPLLNQKFIKKYIDLNLLISKILSKIFIIATLLLSHNNVAFQSILIWLNLSESLSKHKVLLL